MVNNNSTSDNISTGWNYYREGRADAAISEFENILKQNPEDIDATYGLGLAQRAAGKTESAMHTFQKTLELVNKAKAVYEATRTPEQAESNIKTPEDDSFMMLSRMISQRISEIQVAQA
ncbi:MAG: tetratricopeptide repeat protein [Anaerolineae bacterium]|nr:tetratricopeptide repeat protein [Anaerolineae bacterium]